MVVVAPLLGWTPTDDPANDEETEKASTEATAEKVRIPTALVDFMFLLVFRERNSQTFENAESVRES